MGAPRKSTLIKLSLRSTSPQEVDNSYPTLFPDDLQIRSAILNERFDQTSQSIVAWRILPRYLTTPMLFCRAATRIAAFFIFTAVVAFALQPGASRQEVIDHYGNPIGSVQAGAREVLSFSSATVTLEDGRLVSEVNRSDTPGANSFGSQEPLSNSSVNIVAARPVRWLTSLDLAKNKATFENKMILVLFWNPSRHEPWAATFDKTFFRNATLLRRLQLEYVLLHLDPTQIPTADASIVEIDAYQRLEDLRKRGVGDTPLPGMAIVSEDGRKTCKVDLATALGAGNKWRSIAFAIYRAKTQPMENAGISPRLFWFASA